MRPSTSAHPVRAHATPPAPRRGIAGIDRHATLRGLRHLLLIAGLTLAAGCSAPQASDTPAAANAVSAAAKAERLESLLVRGQDDIPDELLLTKAGARAIDPNGQRPVDDPLTCLARAAYWEAKGEGRSGMQGIVNVVINRAADPRFPDSLCGVVKQGGESGSCQFSWWCDGRSDRIREPEAYAEARDVARQALNHQLEDVTDGALYFHARYATPYWAKRFVRTARIGQHLFYRN